MMRTAVQDGAAEDRDGPLTVFYDGACPLCRAEIAQYRDRDAAGRLSLVDVSAGGDDLPEHLDRDAALARFHVMTPDGGLLSGAAGFAAVWARLPGWRWAARMASWPGVLPVLELGYRGFLRLRPVIVRLFVLLQRLRGRDAV